MVEEQVWYLRGKRKTLGPFSANRLRERVAEGRVPLEARARTRGQGWRRVGEIPELCLARRPKPSRPAKRSKSSAIRDAQAAWYLLRSDQEAVGPFTESDLERRARGTEGPVLVWREGLPDWVPVADVVVIGTPAPRVTPTEPRPIRPRSGAVRDADQLEDVYARLTEARDALSAQRAAIAEQRVALEVERARAEAALQALTVKRRKARRARKALLQQRTELAEERAALAVERERLEHEREELTRREALLMDSASTEAAGTWQQSGVRRLAREALRHEFAVASGEAEIEDRLPRPARGQRAA
jgi:GYF domain 2